MQDLIPKIRSIPQVRGASTALAAILRHELKSGRYRPGDKLMPLRQLSDVSKLGYSTVNRAISTLVNEGLLEARKGAGTFVTGSAATRSILDDGQQFKAYTLILPELEPGIYASLQHGFCEAASMLRHQVVVCCTDANLHKQSDAVLQLLDQQTAGVAIVPVPGTEPYLVRALQRAGTPVVQLNHAVAGAHAPIIRLSFQELGQMAARVLAESGHRRITLIGSHGGDTARLYAEGFDAVFRRLRIDPRIDSVFSNYPDPGWQDELMHILEDIVSRDALPTAFFALFDDVAEMIYLTALDRGMRIPEDISLISFGGSIHSGVLGGMISTVTGDEVWAGRKAVELLSQMAGGERPFDSRETFDIPLKYYDGQTIARLD